jgi:predicted Rossmann-fold nucleotide-binding protein
MWKEVNVACFNLYLLYLCLPGKKEVNKISRQIDYDLQQGWISTGYQKCWIIDQTDEEVLEDLWRDY